MPRVLLRRWEIDLATQVQLAHHVEAAIEVRGTRGRIHRTLVTRFFALVHCHGGQPRSVVEHQPRERKQPQKKDKIQPEIEVELAVPLLERCKAGMSPRLSG